MKTKMENKKGGQVRISVACGDDLRFYDLTYKRMSQKKLERAIAQGVQSFAASFITELQVARRGKYDNAETVPREG